MHDLVGKTLAANRSGVAESLLVAALEKCHVDRSKVKIVNLDPPEGSPRLRVRPGGCLGDVEPGVEIARSQYKAQDIFVDRRDLDFQIDFSSWMVTQDFSDRNPGLVRAVNAAFKAEAQWASDHPQGAETIAQQQGKYDDAIRDAFIAQKRRFTLIQVDNAAFIKDLQTAPDWLVARKVLPEPMTVGSHLAKVYGQWRWASLSMPGRPKPTRSGSCRRMATSATSAPRSARNMSRSTTSAAGAADKLGYFNVLLLTGQSCEDSWGAASALAPLTQRRRFMVAVRRACPSRR